MILRLLVESNGLRAITAIIGVCRKAISRIMANVGRKGDEFRAQTQRNIKSNPCLAPNGAAAGPHSAGHGTERPRSSEGWARNVTIKTFHGDREVKDKGIEFDGCKPDGTQIGDLVLTRTRLDWWQGRTTSPNGKAIRWDEFIDFMNARQKGKPRRRAAPCLPPGAAADWWARGWTKGYPPGWCFKQRG